MNSAVQSVLSHPGSAETDLPFVTPLSPDSSGTGVPLISGPAGRSAGVRRVGQAGPTRPRLLPQGPRGCTNRGAPSPTIQSPLSRACHIAGVILSDNSTWV